MPSSKPRSCCPVACTLDVLGDRWTLLVVRDLILGRHHFYEFRESPEGIATNILTDRLARLTAHGLVEKRPSDDDRGRVAYHLTAKGRSLGPVLKAVSDWGLAHLPGTEKRVLPK